MTQQLVEFGKLYDTTAAAKLLGLEDKGGSEIIRRWWRRGEVLQRGTEIIKPPGSKFILVDVYKVRSRWAKEQAQVRQV